VGDIKLAIEPLISTARGTTFIGEILSPGTVASQQVLLYSIEATRQLVWTSPAFIANLIARRLFALDVISPNKKAGFQHFLVATWLAV
jgi:hypothetical protein